ncbi:MAG: hypothetical protein AAGG48_31475 [Planctomycetota bacterium]
MPNSRPISNADGVLAVYTSGLAYPVFGELITACWSDGELIWSGDSVFGGSPYFRAKTDPETVVGVLSRLEHDGLFDSLHDANGCGFGCPQTNILIRFRGRVFHTMSDHEQSELDGRLVAEHTMLTPLLDRKRYPVIAEQPSAYLFSRFLWVELRGLIPGLLPPTGDPTEGELRFEKWNRFEWMSEAAEP